jgi:hypothetical protein
VLSYDEWAAIIVAEAHKLGIKMTPKQVAEGLGVIEAESGGDASSNPPGNEHIGGLAESPAFGSEAERLNPVSAVAAALKEWNKAGKTWWPAWGRWETGETEGAGPTRYAKHLHTATAALAGAGGFTGATAANATGAQRVQIAGASADAPGAAMRFLLTAALVLGGLSVAGLGVTRAVGAGRHQAARA